MPKKKFIDKRHATTFVLGHRSQRDPLLADETAPQNILIPLDEVPDISKGGISSSTAAAGSSNTKRVDTEKRREEQRKFGIYFDDEYDYLQHLKDCNEVSTIKWDVVERIYAPNRESLVEPQSNSSNMKLEDLTNVKIKLPSSVFESEYKEDVGLLNKSAPVLGPRPDLDHDVIAALDDDFDYGNPENALEDNFMELANQGQLTEPNIDREPTAEELEGLFSDEDDDDLVVERMDTLGKEGDVGTSTDPEDSSHYEDEEDDEVGSMEFTFKDEETKSQFTNYSMSSSVVRRNKQLLLMDDRFEKFFEAYDDTEIGALDCDEIEGDINPESSLLLKYAQEFENDRKKEEELNHKITALAMDAESSTDVESEETDDEEPKQKWDCESIISTYSTTKNRPKIIKDVSRKNAKNHIIVSEKTGIPVGVLGKGGLTKDNLKSLDKEYAEEHGNATSVMSGATSVRPKHETTEERKERKLLVKEYRKERRAEKKANTTAFKDEKKRIEKVRLNKKSNVQGLKL